MTSGEEPADSPDADPEPGPALFEIRRHNLDSRTCVLAIEGELDVASAPRFKEELHEPLGAGYRKIVLDLAQVTFIDSTALGVLVSLNYERRLVAGEGLVMAALQPSVMKVFEVTGLLSSFDISPNVETALSRVRDEADELD